MRFNRRNWLKQRFADLYVGDLGEELDTMPLDALEGMVDDLERAQLAGQLNLETAKGIAKLQEIVERYTEIEQ